MEIILSGGDKLIITLTRQEAESLSIDFDHLDYSSPEVKRLLLELLEEGKAETGFSPSGAKLFVEIHSDGDGGRILCFTALAGRAGGNPGIKPVIFSFEDADSLCDGSTRLHGRYGHRVHKSSLYRYHSDYRLIVYPLDYCDKLSIYFLGEYARKVGEGEILAAHIEEHGTEIIRDAAIDTLAKYFG